MGRKSKPTAGISATRQLFLRERGSVRKKWKNRVPIALVYPNAYSLGMSNLGFQLVYHLLNQNDSIVAERVFLPDPGSKPLSVESGRPLSDFPLLFFSVSFEQDYQHLVMLLEMSGIPSLAAERSRKSANIPTRGSGGHPIVVAGGVAAFMNPEPLAAFIDLFIIGEAEPVLPDVVSLLINGLGGRQQKDELLAHIATVLPGCYAPGLYEVRYDRDGNFLAINPGKKYPDLPARIRKVWSDSPGKAASHSRILTPSAEFSDLFMVELGRGCSRGCRFCAAGFIYRPPRLWNAKAIINAIDAKPEDCTRIGLLGMEMARAEDVSVVADYLADKSCSLSFSSLRADIFNPSLLELLGRSNLKSATIAPDGASERLRRVINKGISENDVLNAAEILAQKGIRNLKLYFMVGLPTESQTDLDEMVDLILKVKKIILDIGRTKGKLSTLTLSINCFIPKPWTPFQFHPMEKENNLKQKFKFLRKRFSSIPNIRIKAESPGNALYQAVLSRGDRRVGLALLHTVRNSLTWCQAFTKENITPEYYTARQREPDEPFPWEIIDHGIKREYLWSEYRKALHAKTTVRCDTSRCKRCGVC
jgi:radical SAM superfamily enzyme YgiQ (UPF0313 family)